MSNVEIVERSPEEQKSYKSYDSVKDKEIGGIQFPPEFLNLIEIADLPPHDLKIKKIYSFAFASLRYFRMDV